MRGVRVDLRDVTVHTDPACRKAGQIIPTSRRCVFSAVLTAEPSLMEPIYKVQIRVSSRIITYYD